MVFFFFLKYSQRDCSGPVPIFRFALNIIKTSHILICTRSSTMSGQELNRKRKMKVTMKASKGEGMEEEATLDHNSKLSVHVGVYFYLAPDIGVNACQLLNINTVMQFACGSIIRAIFKNPRLNCIHVCGL